MHRTSRVVIAAIACVFVLASVALAALPKPGATYKGPAMDKGYVYGHVKLVAATSHKLSLVQMKDQCGVVHKFHDVKVAADGSFKATKKNSSGVSVFDIKGQFTSGTRAKGTTGQRGCQNGLTTWVAKKQ